MTRAAGAEGATRAEGAVKSECSHRNTRTHVTTCARTHAHRVHSRPHLTRARDIHTYVHDAHDTHPPPTSQPTTTSPGNVGPPPEPSLQEKVELLCAVLNVGGAQSRVERVDRVVEMIGLQKHVDRLPMAQKVDACFQMVEPMIADFEAVVMALNMTKSESLTETVDRAAHAMVWVWVWVGVCMYA